MTEHRTMKKKNGGNAMNIFGMPSKSNLGDMKLFEK